MLCTSGSLTGHGGGISIWSNSDVQIENTLINRNSSNTGGGVYVANSDINLIYNDISLNTAHHDGGGLTLSSYTTGPHNAMITNCTFYDNAAISNPLISNGIKIVKWSIFNYNIKFNHMGKYRW